MRIRTIMTMAAVFLMATVPVLRAEDAPKPETETTDPGAAKAGKGLTKDERARLKAAREKADVTPEVIAAAKLDADSEKSLALAQKALKTLMAGKAPDEAALKSAEEAVATARKAHTEAHDNVSKVRRAEIAKTDPESAKLDERAFELGKRLQEGRDRKGAKPDHGKGDKAVKDDAKDKNDGNDGDDGKPAGAKAKKPRKAAETPAKAE